MLLIATAPIVYTHTDTQSMPWSWYYSTERKNRYSFKLIARVVIRYGTGTPAVILTRLLLLTDMKQSTSAFRHNSPFFFCLLDIVTIIRWSVAFLYARGHPPAPKFALASSPRTQNAIRNCAKRKIYYWAYISLLWPNMFSHPGLLMKERDKDQDVCIYCSYIFLFAQFFFVFFLIFFFSAFCRVNDRADHSPAGYARFCVPQHKWQWHI